MSERRTEPRATGVPSQLRDRTCRDAGCAGTNGTFIAAPAVASSRVEVRRPGRPRRTHGVHAPSGEAGTGDGADDAAAARGRRPREVGQLPEVAVGVLAGARDGVVGWQ